MEHALLRIVSNGKKFRIQTLISAKLDYNKYFELKSDKVIKIGWGEYKVDALEKYRLIIDNWRFINKNGSLISDYYWGTGSDSSPEALKAAINFKNQYCTPIEFNSKTTAINFIKNKFGQNGLNILKSKEETWEIV